MSLHIVARTLAGLLALPILVLVLLAPAHGAAQSIQNMPVYGGQGGGKFIADCPNGAHLVGVHITTGAWVNSMTGDCQQGKPATPNPVIFLTPVIGSSKGPRSQAGRCDAGEVLQGIKYGFTRDGSKPKFVDYVQLICSRNTGLDTAYRSCLDSENGCWDLHPDRGHNGGRGLKFESRCLSGQQAVGFIGRSGAFVDALAVRCTPDMTPRFPNNSGGNSAACGAGGSCPGSGPGTPTTNKCCSLPYHDPLTGAIGTTTTCGPACP